MTIFVNKGDKPLTSDQLSDRTQAHIDLDWPQWKRERATRLGGVKLTALNAYMTANATDTDANRINNIFNQQLSEYHKAMTRLNQVKLSVGRKAYSEKITTGEQVWDDVKMAMVDVTQTIKHPAIKALPATVTGYDNTDPLNPVVVQVPNPAIVTDKSERVVAQNVISITPAPVKAF